MMRTRARSFATVKTSWILVAQRTLEQFTQGVLPRERLPSVQDLVTGPIEVAIILQSCLSTSR
ncbi:hypothetical protein EYF80_021395 [Liparis tanakae]|uniref:Uncharacterized protein n=1 Tax=Liparis tanakae TaxID=230148 RepID=A0A4Z2HTY8_9TELE|nr:hypothetical protein EYF80_021395 [Liparis tanakae]